MNMKPPKLRLDYIGRWSEIKLEIIKKYAAAYAKVFAGERQKKLPFTHLYIDAFAGAGKHISKITGEEITGSPVNALNVQPGFKEYHFIDLDITKVEELEKIARERSDVKVYYGDC